MRGYIGRTHEFQDPAYAKDWSERFIPTGERLKLFDIMIERVRARTLPSQHIVELGIGPGYLADRLMTQLAYITYEGVDFSQPMLKLAGEHLLHHQGRLTLTYVNLLNPDWASQLEHPIGAFLSSWTLHDLGGERETSRIYQDCHDHLATGGILLNGDFVKPAGTQLEFEPGRFPIDRHLDLLRAAGFRAASCLAFLEQELENPTSAQNYACLEAIT
jgi:SAM-dependent methyltransferase